MFLTSTVISPDTKQFYKDDFIKSCLVYKYLYERYFSQNIEIDNVIFCIISEQNNFKTDSVILNNHPIFSHAFRKFYERYKKGRGEVYVADTYLQEYKTIGFLTDIVYWFFHRGVY